MLKVKCFCLGLGVVVGCLIAYALDLSIARGPRKLLLLLLLLPLLDSHPVCVTVSVVFFYRPKHIQACGNWGIVVGD